MIRTLADRHGSLVILLGILLSVYTSTLVFGGRPALRTVTEMYIQVTLVVGMSSFIGNSGIVSFGHVGFMAVGAYSAAWVTVNPATKGMVMPDLPVFIAELQFSPIPAALFGAGMAGAVALLTGIFLMRLSGIAAAIGTFAFLLITNTILSNAAGWTGGTSSLAGIPAGVRIGTALLGACLAVVAAHIYRTSRWGLALQASRDDEAAARICGVRIYQHRLWAYVVSAAICGMSGAFFAQYLGVISPSAFYTETTFLALAMLICGGIYSLSGAVCGVLVITAVRQLLIGLEKGVDVGGAIVKLPAGAEATLIGVAMIIILIRRPRGLTNNSEFHIPSMPWRQAARTATRKETGRA